MSRFAGKPAAADSLVDVPALVASYYAGVPERSIAEQQVLFGTSGHRGSPHERTFNEPKNGYQLDVQCINSDEFCRTSQLKPVT